MAEKPSQDELMVGLPEPIKLRLSLLLNRDLVKDIPMLKQLPIGPIIGLMQKLSSEIYLPGEFAITAGDVGGTMHFVRSGEVSRGGRGSDEERRAKRAEERSDDLV